MKIHCRTCGCHFDNDFEETLQDDCNLWTDRGFSRLMSVEYKRAMWDAYFSVPVDEIADHTGTIVRIDFSATPGIVYRCNEFEQYVPGYEFMDDDARRAFQKRLFKFQFNQPTGDRLRMQLTEMGEWDKLVAFAEESIRQGVKATTDVVCMSEQKRQRLRNEEDSERKSLTPDQS